MPDHDESVLTSRLGPDMPKFQPQPDRGFAPMPSESVPAWAATQMTNYAQWAGRWSGCADALSWLLRRYPDDPDVAHALEQYRDLKARWENPIVVAPASTRERGDQ